MDPKPRTFSDVVRLVKELGHSHYEELSSLLDGLPSESATRLAEDLGKELMQLASIARGDPNLQQLINLNRFASWIQKHGDYFTVGDRLDPLYPACAVGNFGAVLILTLDARYLPVPERWPTKQHWPSSYELDVVSPDFDSDQFHPLCIACEKGHTDIIRYLLALPEYESLFGCFQALCGSPLGDDTVLSLIETLIQKAASMQSEVNFNAVGRAGYVPIEMAVDTQKWKLVEWLLHTKVAIPRSFVRALLSCEAPGTMLLEWTRSLSIETLERCLSFVDMISADAIGHVFARYITALDNYNETFAFELQNLLSSTDGNGFWRANQAGEKWYHILAKSGRSFPLMSLLQRFILDADELTVLNGKFSPLYIAVAHGHLEVVQRLDEHEFSVEDVSDKWQISFDTYQQATDLAIQTGQFEMVHFFFTTSRLVKARELRPEPKEEEEEEEDGARHSWFHHVHNHNRWLKEKAASSEAEQASCTALATAVRFCNINPEGQRILNFLLESKWIDCCMRDSTGHTAFHEACEKGNLEVLELLLQKVETDEAQVSVLQSETAAGWTCLHFACKANALEVVENLCKLGVKHATEHGGHPSRLATDYSVASLCQAYDFDLYSRLYERPSDALQVDKGAAALGCSQYPVYRAFLDGAPVAAKSVPGVLLRREAGLHGRAHHPNIIRLLAVCEIQGEHFLVTERGRNDLYKELNSSPSIHISQEMKCKWAYQIMCGLSHLHALSPLIIHGDLRPQNVILTDSSDIRLIDFGGADLERSAEGLGKGNRAISLPGEKPSTARDVFSFGLLLLSMFCSTPQAEIRLVRKVRHKSWHLCPVIKKHEDPQLENALEKSAKALHESSLWALVLQCLSKDPSNRAKADFLRNQLYSSLQQQLKS